MIHEEICIYEVCKLAKEKGFNEPTIDLYIGGVNWLGSSLHPFTHNETEDDIAAPTQSLLQRWLREEKNIHIEIIATASGYYWCISKTNGTSITDSDILNRGTNEGGCFDIFEECLEDCEKYALEKLV